MSYKNEMFLKFKALSENESFARICVASFLASTNPSIDELGDIKTAISEAVTNCVVHAYPNKSQQGDIEIFVQVQGCDIYISVKDFGVGIEDIEKAKEPFFTSKPEAERSGMGFTVMEGFMDSLQVKSVLGQGVVVEMTKKLGRYNLAIGG